MCHIPRMAAAGGQEKEVPMRLEYFTGPEGVRGIREAAKEILEGRSPQHPEMQMALRKLLEARDCLVRAHLAPEPRSRYEAGVLPLGDKAREWGWI